jgi:peroxiredoxin
MGQLSARRQGSKSTLALRAAAAPDFALPSTDSKMLSLQSLRGQYVVLIFYPCDWEPVSREQLTLFQEYADEFIQLNARLLGISIDHLWSHRAFACEAGIQFSLLADFYPKGSVACSYGIYRRRGVSSRALFVLDRSGVIHFSQKYPDALNPGVDSVLTTLEALARMEAHGAVCPSQPVRVALGGPPG